MPRIVLDFSSLDTVNPGSGQYRYVVDLVRGLARADEGPDFVLVGSRPEPAPELAPALARSSRWRYRQWARSRGAGAEYRDHARLSWLLARERADLLHALHGFVPLFAPCPVVATLYDLMLELFPEYVEAVRSRPYRIQRWAMRRRARRVIAISETTARDARRLWDLAPDRVDVVPLGSGLDAAAVAGDPPGLPPGALVVLSPMNLEPRKNIARLLEAMAAIRARVPAARLVLYGRAAVTPEREAAFARRVEELALGPLLVLTGLLDDADLARWYRRADLFVFPSLYEGFGLPVLEAMAAGACVVARDASAMAEVVGDAGVLVDTTNAAALAETLVSLLADPARRRALGERARRRAAGFTVERMARQTLEVYARALHLDGWR